MLDRNEFLGECRNHDGVKATLKKIYASYLNQYLLDTIRFKYPLGQFGSVFLQIAL